MEDVAVGSNSAFRLCRMRTFNYSTLRHVTTLFLNDCAHKNRVQDEQHEMRISRARVSD